MSEKLLSVEEFESLCETSLSQGKAYLCEIVSRLSDDDAKGLYDTLMREYPECCTDGKGQ